MLSKVNGAAGKLPVTRLVTMVLPSFLEAEGSLV